MPSWKPETLDLTNWGVLITGATSGIGEACAWQFAEKGARLIMVGRREERLVKLQSDICAEFGRDKKDIVFFAQDVSKIDELESFAKKLPFDCDILVNNAGLALGTDPVDSISIDDVRKMIEVNVMSLIALTRIFTEGMKARGRGHVINISSVAGIQSYEGGCGYNASKFAVKGFTDSMRMDLAGTPIRVTTVSPGMVNTEFSTVRFEGDKGKADTVYNNIVPLVAADVADNVVYAATRPAHVQVADVYVLATNQGDAKYTVKRVGENLGAPPEGMASRVQGA